MNALLADRLRLVDAIGEGGCGTVWRAWDVCSRAYVAAKVLADSRTIPADLPAGLRHPHVLTPDAWLVDEGRRIAIMRLVRGGTADRLLASHGALPPAYVAVLLDQLLTALCAVHGTGLVHRDVKPANLLLEPSGTGRPHLHLADLDVAAERGSAPSTSAGTTGYGAPETGPGGPPEPRHDLYAAGVTAAELLTGHRPRRPRDLPRGPLRGILLALTDPDPAGRPASAADARTALAVPTGSPWRRTPHPPHVPDRLPRLTVMQRMVAQRGLRGSAPRSSPR